MRHQQLVG